MFFENTLKILNDFEKNKYESPSVFQINFEPIFDELFMAFFLAKKYEYFLKEKLDLLKHFSDVIKKLNFASFESIQKETLAEIVLKHAPDLLEKGIVKGNTYDDVDFNALLNYLIENDVDAAEKLESELTREPDPAMIIKIYIENYFRETLQTEKPSLVEIAKAEILADFENYEKNVDFKSAEFLEYYGEMRENLIKETEKYCDLKEIKNFENRTLAIYIFYNFSNYRTNNLFCDFLNSKWGNELTQKKEFYTREFFQSIKNTITKATAQYKIKR